MLLICLLVYRWNSPDDITFGLNVNSTVDISFGLQVKQHCWYLFWFTGEQHCWYLFWFTCETVLMISLLVYRWNSIQLLIWSDANSCFVWPEDWTLQGNNSVKGSNKTAVVRGIKATVLEMLLAATENYYCCKTVKFLMFYCNNFLWLIFYKGITIMFICILVYRWNSVYMSLGLQMKQKGCYVFWGAVFVKR